MKHILKGDIWQQGPRWLDNGCWPDQRLHIIVTQTKTVIEEPINRVIDCTRFSSLRKLIKTTQLGVSFYLEDGNKIYLSRSIELLGKISPKRHMRGRIRKCPQQIEAKPMAVDRPRSKQHSSLWRLVEVRRHKSRNSPSMASTKKPLDQKVDCVLYSSTLYTSWWST